MLAPIAPPNTRVDHLLIAEMVAAGSRVLDVGCGDGALLQLLADTKNVSSRRIFQCPKFGNETIAWRAMRKRCSSTTRGCWVACRVCDRIT